MQTSGDQRREIAKMYPRHCERSEAIHLSACGHMDCFASLAMTWREHRHETAASYSVVIVREGGRSSIPETQMIEPISRGVLDTPPSRGMTIPNLAPPAQPFNFAIEAMSTFKFLSLPPQSIVHPNHPGNRGGN
jgi:hypothetical protein